MVGKGALGVGRRTDGWWEIEKNVVVGGEGVYRDGVCMITASQPGEWWTDVMQADRGEGWKRS